MNVRTVSQLPETLSAYANDLIEVSQQVDAASSPKYVSRKIKFSNLSGEITTTMTNDLETKYGLFNDCIVVLNNRISENSESNINFQKNIKNLDSKISELSSTKADDFSENMSILSGYVCPTATSNERCGGSNLYSLSIQTDTQNTTNEITIDKGGQFVCYGWLTGSNRIDPAQAYVALEAYISNKWVLIQLQPWIIGAHSQYMQYVGFNAPVSKGLKLRITTGFKIEDFDQSYASKGLIVNVKSDNTHTNSMNTFVGYVLNV